MDNNLVKRVPAQRIFGALQGGAKELTPTCAAVSDLELACSQVVGMFVMVVVLWGMLLLRVALTAKFIKSFF